MREGRDRRRSRPSRMSCSSVADGDRGQLALLLLLLLLLLLGVCRDGGVLFVRLLELQRLHRLHPVLEEEAADASPNLVEAGTRPADAVLVDRRGELPRAARLPPPQGPPAGLLQRRVGPAENARLRAGER